MCVSQICTQHALKEKGIHPGDENVQLLLSQAKKLCTDNYSFMNVLFKAVEDRVSQSAFDPSLVLHIRSFLQESGEDYFMSLCAGIEVE